MPSLVFALVVGLTPAGCESPPVRDVAALQAFAAKSGALSVGLDSVATWCFDSGGAWTGGASQKIKTPAAATGDCAKALASCETAKAEVTASMKQLLDDALADLERPFVGKRYVPKRSGLADRPSQVVDCSVRNRPSLFAQAQARMDLARMASQAHAEYVNYKTWLYAEGLKCAQAPIAEPDRTRKNVGVDAPAALAAPSPGPGPGQGKTVALPIESALLQAPVKPPVDAGRPAGALEVTPSRPVLPVGGPSTERERVMALAPVDRWVALREARSRLELDRDYTLGFLVSRELRDCRCQRPNPAGLARRYAQSDNLAELEAAESKNVQCELCMQDAFAGWKVRLEKQCALIEKLSDFEVGVLQRSDDGNGLPPRCFDSVMAGRGFDAGSASASRAFVFPVADSGVRASAVQALALPSPAFTESKPPSASEWAPIPLREEGRLYVRLFMSSGCAADVLPGPIQARTGDLLVIPFNARQLSVRSPCGGVAEVYWGREARPRVSEIFARNQTLHLQFQPQ